MAIVINGSGTVTGLSVGGLPDGTVDEGTLATDSVTAAKIPDTVEAGFKSGRKNLIINGAMQVAQRSTSSTSSGLQTIDRFTCEFSGTDEAPTQAQVDVASGTPAYESGFRKAFKITNGNQTSGAGAGDYINFQTKLEAQNIAQSGWNYPSSSSSITLSFYIKSSVAQNFYGFLRTRDGTEQNYPFETGSLTADTWTKVTKTIIGNSNLTFNVDNGEGVQINIAPFWGTNNTGSVNLNAWANYSGGTRTPDNTSTWYTTNDATFEITGLQLELGSTATEFEHRSFGEELALCQRYYYAMPAPFGAYYSAYGTRWFTEYSTYPVVMRANPSVSYKSGSVRYSYYQYGWVSDNLSALATKLGDQRGISLCITATGSYSPSNHAMYTAESNSYVANIDAEL